MNRCTTNWSHLTPRDQVRHLELEGFVVIPEVLSPDRVASIQAELDRLPTEATDYSENQRGFKDVQWTDSPSSIDTIAVPAMIDFLERLFGDELICTSCVYALSRPGHP